MQTDLVADANPVARHLLRRYDQLPGPRGVPVFGNAFQLDVSSLHLQLEEWCRKYGAYYRLKVGSRRHLVVGEHEAVAAVLRDRPDGLRRSSRLEQIWVEMGLRPGVFLANGEAWRRQRRMVMAGLDPAHVKGYFPSLCVVAQHLAGRWQTCAEQGLTIDLQSDLMRYTVDTIAGLAFGTEVNTLQSGGDVIQRHLDKIFPAIARRLVAPIPTWRFWRSRADRELERSITAVIAAVDEFILRARMRLRRDPSRVEHPQNLLEAMLVAADRADSGMDDRQVAGNVLTMLLAGEDTTANTIAWMIYLLWRHPRALARATAEVRSVMARSARPAPEDMERLHYVEACAHETMRLKPVAPLMVLQTLREMTIGDIQVPPGVVVFVLMRRDSVSEAYVSRPADFEPERWLVEGGVGRAATAAKRISMPFGAGPRICPGRYLALLEMKMAMATLLGGFDIETVDTPDGGEARERLSFTMTPVGLSMRLRNRGRAGGTPGRVMEKSSPGPECSRAISSDRPATARHRSPRTCRR